MKYPDNIEAVGSLPINFMGFIFYSKSPRYVGDSTENLLNGLSQKIKRVGVFVNESIDYVADKAEKYNLDFIQLHGQETVAYCEQLKSIQRMPIIKAFNVSEPADFLNTKDYERVCDYFLFDTKTPQHGGSGVKFDWSVLDHYKGEIPFLLSGGISVDDVPAVKQLNHPQLFALDLNSRFETSPGVKDINLLTKFITNLNIQL